MRDIRIVEDALELEESHNGRFTRGVFLPERELAPEQAEEEEFICPDYWPRLYSSNSPFKRRSGYE